MKVKVSVIKLIEKVAIARDQAIEAHEKTVEEYPAKDAAYRKAIAARLRSMASEIEKGKGVVPSNRWDTVWDKVEPPLKPRKKPDLSRYNNRMRELNLCATDTLLIDPNDREWQGIL